MTNEEIANRLDTIIAILRLAYRDNIDAARSTIRSDAVSAAILDNTTTWTRSAQLTSAVRSKTKQSYPTVNRRINDLLAAGALERKGAGSATEYRSRGLI